MFAVGEKVKWVVSQGLLGRDRFHEGYVVEVVPEGVIPIGCSGDLGYTGTTYLVSRVNTYGKLSTYWFDEKSLQRVEDPPPGERFSGSVGSG
jgi:hypothetical protein